RVDAHERAGHDAADRGDVDDRAAARLRHALAGLDRHVEVAADVDVDRLLERGDVGIEDRAEVRIRRRVVDQDVDAAEPRVDLGPDGLDRLELADVAGDDVRLAAGLADLLGDALAIGRLATRDDDVRAV